MIPQWLQDEVQKYDLDFIEPPKTILDIGANIGAFSLWALQKWNPAGITAYEPEAKNFSTLRQNTLADPRIVPLHYAVSALPITESWLYIGDASVTHSFIKGERQTDTRQAVDCIYARHLPPADLIKLDTEGNEVSIIANMVLDQVKALVCEYHTTEDCAAIKNIMAERGFDLISERASSDTVGILKFARPGVVRVLKEHVFIAVPVYGGNSPVEFWQSLMKFQADPSCNFSLCFMPGDSLIPRARNTLTAKFLESDCTHLLFIDSDLVFSGDQIRRLLDHDKDVVAGFYPKKKDGPDIEWVCNVFNGVQPVTDDGLQRIDYAGTGFLLIKRAVFERMIATYGPHIKYHPDPRPQDVEYDFWPVGVYPSAADRQLPKVAERWQNRTGRYLSEDWYFCQRWLDLGGEIHGDTRVILKHIGAATYPLLHQQQKLLAATAPDQTTQATT